MRLKIGDYEIPERCLKFVFLYPNSSCVSFAGVFVGEDGRIAGKELRRSAQVRAVPFEAVDRNGVGSAGLCDVKDLKLASRSSIIKFSGRLVRPFEN